MFGKRLNLTNQKSPWKSLATHFLFGCFPSFAIIFIYDHIPGSPNMAMHFFTRLVGGFPS